MNVEFFNQLSFFLPSLLQFVRVTDALTFRSAALYFDKDCASLIVGPLDKHTGADDCRRTHPLLMQVKGKPLDWQVTTITRPYRSPRVRAAHITSPGGFVIRCMNG